MRRGKTDAGLLFQNPWFFEKHLGKDYKVIAVERTAVVRKPQ